MRRETLPLSQAAQNLIEECRMVLPGIQALFGFQLSVVFQPGFSQKLSPGEQHLHLLSIALLAIAIALIMTPAAYHRQTGPEEVTDHFIRLAGRLLLAAMIPMIVSICLDFYLLARVSYGGYAVPSLAGLLFLFFVLLWFVLPRLRRDP